MHSPSPYSSDRACTPPPDRTYSNRDVTDSKDSTRRSGPTRRCSTGDRPFVVQSASTAGTRLAQEIHDEFLVCKICLDAYRNPKCLACLHTFCEECIESHIASESTYKKYSDYREFTCPLCRKRTQLPVGGVRKLTDNFLVSSLSELVARQRPSRYPFCDICKSLSGKHRDATSKCLDCAKLLCATCVQLHRQTKVTSGHSLFDVEIEKDIECREHRDEAVRFYCRPCDTCVCVLCTFNEHREHDIEPFADAVGRYRTDIVSLLDACRLNVDRFDARLERLNRCDEVIREAEQRVHDTAIEFIQEIRTRERQLIEELHNVYGPDCMDSLEGRKELSSQMENLRSTCQLTEMILGGKDIELLLLKKDVVEKLTALGAIDVKPAPSTSSKVVRFVPGSLELGYLHDDERPLISSMKRPRLLPWNIVSTSDDDYEPAAAAAVGPEDNEKVDCSTQTERNDGEFVDSGIQTDDVKTPPSAKPLPAAAAASNSSNHHTSNVYHGLPSSTASKDLPQFARPAKHFTK